MVLHAWSVWLAESMLFMAQKTGAYANLSEGIFWMTIPVIRVSLLNKKSQNKQNAYRI
jgi:hypothetical protein